MMSFTGSELYWDPSLGFFEKWYCRLLGVPIIGLRIRLRRLYRLLPKQATTVLDAGCGRGVITRALAQLYPDARIDAVDENLSTQDKNKTISGYMGLDNCHYIVSDLLNYQKQDAYDLIVSVDNLEHIEDDSNVLNNFFSSMKQGGILVVHVPHYYRRWPVFKWKRNFDVPGHVRPGYHLPELLERVRYAGFVIVQKGFSYGPLENLVNNVSYAITGARERKKMFYAILFPALNAIAWFGQWSRPGMGAGVWVIAKRLRDNNNHKAS